LQTTLLGLAIAIIVALVTALVGPLLVDWGGYRSMFEAEATRLVGLDVHVAGAIDARLLPSPQLALHDITIGRGGDEKIGARLLAIEFALGPLMRGEWRASEMHLVGPQLRLGIDASGHVQAPGVVIGFDPDALSIDRLGIEDGTVTLADAASGGSLTLDHVWFNGEARSLLGPFKGEGAATLGGELYPFRLGTGRLGDDGKLKLHLNIDPVTRPISVELDGLLSAAAAAPAFDGTLKLARSVGLAAAGHDVTQPWRLNSKVKATADQALMQEVEFQYGSQDKSFKLTGAADFKFGKTPSFNGVLSGGQIDLDRALAETDGRVVPPAAVMRRLAQLVGGAFRPKIPIQLGIGIDQATLGGDSVQSLRGDISTDQGGWNLDRFEFRSPGFTQVRASGHLAVDEDRVAFAGPAEIKTTDPKALAAWLEGRAAPGRDELRPLSLRGDLTLASDKIGIERLTAEFDRKTLTGGFSYAFVAGPKPARLDATVNAAELDMDAALSFGAAMLAGTGIERPRDIAISADIGRAEIGGLDARGLSARVSVDEMGVRIDKLSVADLEGSTFSVNGRVATVPVPQGTVDIDLNARDGKPLSALIARFAPQTADAIARRVSALAPAKLHGRLSLGGAASAAEAKLAIDGTLGAAHLALNASARGNAGSFSVDDAKLSGEADADDGKQLLAMLGLDRIFAAAAGPAKLTFAANGPPLGALQIKAAFKAGNLDATIEGAAKPFADKRSADIRAVSVHGNLLSIGEQAVPVRFSGALSLNGDDLAVHDIDASLAGASVHGRLSTTLSTPQKLQGEIDADRIGAVPVLAQVIGLPAPANAGERGAWSADPFGAGLFGDYSGRIVVKARTLELSPRLVARDFNANLDVGSRQISLADIVGDVSGGRLTGDLSFHSTPDGLRAASKFTLAGADASALLPSAARPPIAGTLALSAEVEGHGLSPDALIGSLKGSGQIALINGEFAGLDPRVFDTVTRAVDGGLVVESTRISDLVNKGLQDGQLSIRRAQSDLAISVGQVRLGKFTADVADARLSANGSLDLTTGLIDGRLVLSAGSEQTGSRPNIFVALSGPLMAATRTIDVSALTAWLTLRSIDNQSKQLRDIEHRTTAPMPPQRPKSDVSPAAKPPRSSSGQSTSAIQKRAPNLPPPVEVGTVPGSRRAEPPAASAIGVQR